MILSSIGNWFKKVKLSLFSSICNSGEKNNINQFERFFEKVWEKQSQASFLSTGISIKESWELKITRSSTRYHKVGALKIKLSMQMHIFKNYLVNQLKK